MLSMKPEGRGAGAGKGFLGSCWRLAEQQLGAAWVLHRTHRTAPVVSFRSLPDFSLGHNPTDSSLEVVGEQMLCARGALLIPIPQQLPSAHAGCRRR